MSNWKYKIPEECDESIYDVPKQRNIINGIEFEYSQDDAEYAAQAAGENDYHNHDGWDSIWPKTFEMFYKGKSEGLFSIDAEPSIHISATRI